MLWIHEKAPIFELRSLIFAGDEVLQVGDCPFRYQGQYENKETGLYYNRFRYYDSSTGGYISKDPIRLAGRLTLYS